MTAHRPGVISGLTLPDLYWVNPQTEQGAQHLRVAWDIARERPAWYAESGGRDDWQVFYEQSRASEWWLIVAEKVLHSIVSLLPLSDTELQFDLYTPRGGSFAVICAGVYRLGQQWIEQRPDEQRRLSILIPSFHRASRRLALTCGMRPTGEGITDGTFRGKPVIWQRYAITSAMYYGQENHDHHTEQQFNEQLRLLQSPDNCLV